MDSLDFIVLCLASVVNYQPSLNVVSCYRVLVISCGKYLDPIAACVMSL